MATVNKITTTTSSFNRERIAEMLPTWADHTIEYTHRWISNIEVIFDDGETMELGCSAGYIAPVSYGAHDGFLWFVTHALDIIAASKNDFGCYNDHYNVIEIKHFMPIVERWCNYNVGKTTPSDFDSVVKNHYAARKLLDSIDNIQSTVQCGWGEDINVEQWMKLLNSSGSDHVEVVIEEEL